MAANANKVSPAEVTHALKGVNFPAARHDLVGHAKSHKADANVIRVIKQLPEQEYRSMADVMKGVGKIE